MREAHSGSFAELIALSTLDLRARWAKVFGRPHPVRAGRDLLLRALVHRLQEQVNGSLSARTRKHLAELARGNAQMAPIRSKPHLKPGIRLVREWCGETHHVTVLGEGFEYRGERFESLSKIARIITGTRWSGPAFFGLKSNRMPGNVSGDTA